MATTPRINNGIDRSLSMLMAELAFLPEMAALWANESEHNRLNYSLEWDDLMGRLVGLKEAYQAGELSSVQHERFEQVLAKLAHVIPLLRQMNLYFPPIALLA